VRNGVGLLCARIVDLCAFSFSSVFPISAAFSYFFLVAAVTVFFIVARTFNIDLSPWFALAGGLHGLY